MEDSKSYQSLVEMERTISELTHLRQHLANRDEHVSSMENELSKSSIRITELEEQLSTWREKYERLYDSHKRVQKLNQILEDKLLGMVDKGKADKSQLTKDIATLSLRLAETKHSLLQINKENERYKNDMNLAIQLLQCKPDNFVSQKLDNLSGEMQTRVSQYVMSKTKPSNSSPPNSLHSSKNGNEIENIDPAEYEFNISPSLMTKMLVDSMQDTITKHCDTCSCNNTQKKPFMYGEQFYTVATQTILHGDMKNSLCLNCNSDIMSHKSNLSQRSSSPLVANFIKRTTKSPVFIVRQTPTLEEDVLLRQEKTVKHNDIVNDKIKSEDRLKLVNTKHKEIVSKLGEDLTKMRNNFQMEPVSHHRLCSKTSPGSSKDLQGSPLIKNIPEVHNGKGKLDKQSEKQRKDSQASTLSRNSSAAKSTSSTQKSNTNVGPGPRFCSVRMQEGSNNILLDNALPDVPPIIYRRQSRNEIFDSEFPLIPKAPESTVVESTLIDVNTETPTESRSDINAIVNLMKVSPFPLQPLKSHNYSSSTQSGDSKSPLSPITTVSPVNTLNCNTETDDGKKIREKDNESVHDVKQKEVIKNDPIEVFNFDSYEKKNMSNDNETPEYEGGRKIQLSESLKIPNNFPATMLPANETKYESNNHDADKNKLSVSSLSSEDSNLILQKQQLKRVAEWVQQNLEQNHNFDQSTIKTDDTVLRNNFKETIQTDLQMPLILAKQIVNHCQNVLNDNKLTTAQEMPNEKTAEIRIISKIVKETVFPAECSDPISQDSVRSEYGKSDVGINVSDKESKELSSDELARMEYNVKKFLLSGYSISTQAQTNSKTETDI